MAKRITLTEWGARHYSDPPKSEWQLRKMAREGKIHPPPVKEGREYRVLETARHIDWPMTLVERLQA